MAPSSSSIEGSHMKKFGRFGVDILDTNQSTLSGTSSDYLLRDFLQA
jgi:hypothetical protein